ncbi:SDR family oxidoreductase [Leifsonia sp. 21MFCrub1.1]|uniref:SDR family oxidoreductase n=1 Tax=Leifsonia sp. 21MFCrub1.1 TaxID=1798223 RepID=UPI0008929FD9|nr:SDR family oxidoreductase [Leifsonia sp. 21MFCrub1.1]SEA64304.1 3-oxoacyl-[acyl-carrier protein] reductase [Leifsonia sp. 21MFCrub1.1]
MDAKRPVVFVTGASRPGSIGDAIARNLASIGFDVAFGYWDGYDSDMPWGAHPAEHEALAEELRRLGARALPVSVDLADAEAPAAAVARVRDELGPVQALVMSHAHSVDSGILDTSVEAFDRHFAVNTRGSWLLIRAFAEQFPSGAAGLGRIVALTSDHTAHNLPYGASKGALDRIVKAAAVELAHLGITANLINPGPIDTGWMTPELVEQLTAETALGRLGRPHDTADLVAFLLSVSGGWITGQLLHSNGGFHLDV